MLLNKKLKIILKEIDYRKAFKYGKQRVLRDVRFTELSENYDMSEASGTLILKYFANWIEEAVTTNNNDVIEKKMNSDLTSYTESVFANGEVVEKVVVLTPKEEEKIKEEKETGKTNVENKSTNTTSNPLIVLVGQSTEKYEKYLVKDKDVIWKIEDKLGLKDNTPFYRLSKNKYNVIQNRNLIYPRETIYYKTSISKEGTVVTPYAQAIVQRKTTVKEINLEQSGKCYVLQNKKYAPIPEDITLNQGDKIYFTKNGSEDKTREGIFNKELFDKDFNTSNKKIYIFEPYTFKENDTVWDIERKYKVKVYKTKSLLGTNSKNFYSDKEAKKIKIGTTVYLTTPGYEKTQNNTLESKK